MTPLQFWRKLAAYSWGMLDAEHRLLDDSDCGAYRTLDPIMLHATKTGTCWDYVEAQRNWYEENGIEHRTFYLELNNREKASHTVLIHKYQGQYAWVEAAWKSELGIHPGTSRRQLLQRIMAKHKASCPDKGLRGTVYEYPRPNRYGMDIHEFKSWVERNGTKIRICSSRRPVS